jgi:hypothetical protein
VLTPASRRVIDCGTGRRSVTGWSIVSEADLAQEDLQAVLEDDLDRLVADHGPSPHDWDIPVLAESRWDSALLAEGSGGDGDGGSGTGGSGNSSGSGTGGNSGDESERAPVAGEFLVLLQGHYVLYETEGVDWGWDYIEAPDDESAIAAFRATVGEG